MRTLLYEVTLHNPVTKKAYPEEFVGLRSIAGISPGAQFYIQVKVNFSSIPPSQNGNLAQTVEIEVTVNDQDIGWVFDVTREVPVCTFMGFPSSLGQITPFKLESNIPTILPDNDKNHGNYDDEWLEELYTVQVHATVIYAYADDGDAAAEDPVPIDFFKYPADTLYYHSTGTMEVLKNHYSQQKRSSAQALDVALSAAITAAEYEDFYADNYDPNNDEDYSSSDNDNNGNKHEFKPSKLNYDESDSDSDVQVVAHYPAPAKSTVTPKQSQSLQSQQRPNVHNHYQNYDSSSSDSDKNGAGDDDIGDDEDDDDWWGTAAQPKANDSIVQQKLRHQQSLQQNHDIHSNQVVDLSHSSKKRNFAVAASEYLQDSKDNDFNSDSDIDRPPTKRPFSDVKQAPAASAAQSKAGVTDHRPLRAAKSTAGAKPSTPARVPSLPPAANNFTFASKLSMDSDSEGD